MKLFTVQKLIYAQTNVVAETEEEALLEAKLEPAASWEVCEYDISEDYSIVEEEEVVTLCVEKVDDSGIRQFQFTVTRDFLLNYLGEDEAEEEFLDEYTSEDSLSIYEEAVLNGEIISVTGDCWFDDEENEGYGAN